MAEIAPNATLLLISSKISARKNDIISYISLYSNIETQQSYNKIPESPLKSCQKNDQITTKIQKEKGVCGCFGKNGKENK